MLLPEETHFLDSSIVIRLIHRAVPGAKKLIDGVEFSPGTSLEAYTVAFKPYSRKSHAVLGDYLIINDALYRRHKAWPVWLNLRLNYNTGYGRQDPPKGRLLREDEAVIPAKREESLTLRLHAVAKRN